MIRWLLEKRWRAWYEAGFADGASEALGCALRAIEGLPGADIARAELQARKARVDLDIKRGQAAAARKETER